MAKRQTAVFGGGCFWCIEAIFSAAYGRDTRGVRLHGRAQSTIQPTVRVCDGDTGHVEVVRVTLQIPTKSVIRELLDVFFTVHDPTTTEPAGK